jgi:tripartite-type tricarboxylate transporter receptor subunit TctC
VFAPKGTPKPVIDKLVAALDKGLDEDAVRKRLESLGATVAEPSRRGPAALGALVHSEIARLTPILKAAAAK